VATGGARTARDADDFLAVVCATVDGILVVDDEGVVRFANPAAAAVLGRSEEELLDLPFGLPLTGSGGFAQLDVARADGAEMVVEMHVAPLWWHGAGARIVTLRDITQRVRAERALARSEERFALSAQGANDGLWDWSSETGLVHTSARLQEMLGRPRRPTDETVEDLLALVHPDDAEELQRAISRHLRGVSRRLRQELRLRRRDGAWVWVMVRGLAVGPSDRVERFAGSVTDITERRQAEESLRRLALRDPLTGLANRTLFLDHLHEAIERVRRADVRFAVLFCDLDRFKLVNDSLGHSAGDVVLQEIARRLERCIRRTDTVARLGGDEFAVLLDGPKDVATIVVTVERLRRAIAAPVVVGPHVVHVTASVGVARSEDLPGDPDTALRYADIAMYDAKAAGRNDYRIFTTAMQAQASARLQLHSDLREAAERGRFVPYYQPLVDLVDGSVVGFEALLRWEQAPASVVSAAAFIDAAEEIELIVPVGWQVLATAARQLRDWRASGFDVEVSVNLSHRQFVGVDAADQLAALLADLGLEGKALGIEITERTAIVHADAVVDQIARLRELGVGILVDDFGTGYSSLAAIHRLPLTALKIDRGFVADLDGAGSTGVVAAIIAMAGSLGLQVVAEGIETPAQRAVLRDLGCPLGQGYLFGAAVAADAASRVLQARGRRRT